MGSHLPIKMPDQLIRSLTWDRGAPSAIVRQRRDRGVLGSLADRTAQPAAMEHSLELANAIFEYLEIFHNRQRRHSALGWMTPVEYEKMHTSTNVA